jgi:protein-disulfide isomerase
MKPAQGITVLAILTIATGAAAAGETDVVGYIGDEPITRAQVSERVSAELVQIRQQEYDVLSNGFEQLVAERLLEKEAAARSITPDELMKAEVEDKVQGPSPEAIDRFYEQNKARMGGRTREQAGPDIENYLRQMERAQLQGALLDRLRAKASVRVVLEPPRVDVPIPAGEPARGPADAAVVMVEFSDFQCPFCRRAHPTVERVLGEYGDRLRFVYRDYPLPNHPRATPSAEAARCAGDQKKYWEYHTALMTGVGSLDDEDLGKHAEALQLDMEAFRECVASKRHAGAVQAGLLDGARIGVNGTPAFYINGRLISGALPYETFKKMIDEELARASSAPATGKAR